VKNLGCVSLEVGVGLGRGSEEKLHVGFGGFRRLGANWFASFIRVTGGRQQDHLLVVMGNTTVPGLLRAMRGILIIVVVNVAVTGT
jgi:hypothetical protein